MDINIWKPVSDGWPIFNLCFVCRYIKKQGKCKKGEALVYDVWNIHNGVTVKCIQQNITLYFVTKLKTLL